MKMLLKNPTAAQLEHVILGFLIFGNGFCSVAHRIPSFESLIWTLGLEPVATISFHNQVLDFFSSGRQRLDCGSAAAFQSQALASC